MMNWVENKTIYVWRGGGGVRGEGDVGGFG